VSAEEKKEVSTAPVYTKRKDIQELFADDSENFVSGEIDWGEPVGDETW